MITASNWGPTGVAFVFLILAALVVASLLTDKD